MTGPATDVGKLKSSDTQASRVEGWVSVAGRMKSCNSTWRHFCLAIKEVLESPELLRTLENSLGT
jgi:hypothetical protein